MRDGVQASVAHRLRVRYGETDQMGVVYHAHYLVWFNEARDALLRAQGICLASVERSGYRFPVVDITCRYRHPARYGDEVIVHASLLRETVARLRLRYDVSLAQGGRLLASGASVQVVTDLDGRVQLRPPPPLALLWDRSPAQRSPSHAPHEG